MKLLVITYSYTPDLTPRAFRWSAIVAELVRMGHEVHVLCAVPGTAVSEHNGAVIYRVPDQLLNASTRVSARGTGEPSPRHGLRAMLRAAVRALWRGVYWPDYAWGWVIPATKAARSLCASNHYDWIVSVSHPFSGHLIGLLTKPVARNSRWLADIGDPFYLMKEPSPNNRRLYAWLSRAVERRVIAAADAISVTTESTRSLYEKNFPQSTGKVSVIPPLLSLPEIPQSVPREKGTPIRLAFVGTLYRKLRSPGFLLNCFAALVQTLPERSVELHFYGATNDCAEELASCPAVLKPVLFVHGMVERQDVLQAMMNADVLVNIGNDSKAQLASKVVEYMAVGKPILNLISITADASVLALADYPAALTIPRVEGPLPAPLLEALQDFVLHPPSVPESCVADQRRRYSAEYVAERYAAILEK